MSLLKGFGQILHRQPSSVIEHKNINIFRYFYHFHQTKKQPLFVLDLLSYRMHLKESDFCKRNSIPRFLYAEKSYCSILLLVSCCMTDIGPKKRRRKCHSNAKVHKAPENRMQSTVYVISTCMFARP